MLTSQLLRTMAILRISLAEIDDKERQLESMISQFRMQLRRLPRQVIYGKTGLDASLSSMGEIEERLSDSTSTLRRLQVIKKATLDELAALESVKQVSEARRSLADLKRAMRDYPDDPQTLSEVRRLEWFITEHSKMAEMAITERFQEPISDS